MWQARPVFISSTFLDMQAERDYLRTRVFPELEERLRTRRHHLEWVDLRVGVAMASQPSEGLRELRVLKVCLAEVRRCRPFLIVLLGDRYGWVPPLQNIKAAALEQGFSNDVAGRSVTELEIDFGVLSDTEQQPRSIFYFREPLPYRDMPPQTALLYSDACDPDPAAADRAKRLAALKQRIEQQLPVRVRHYSVQWDHESECVAGLENWGRMVLDDVWSELENHALHISDAGISWQQVERNALDDFVEDRARDFVGRKELIKRLTDFATQPEEDGAAWGICVTGEAGSGKSALFGELNRRLAQSNSLVLAHAAGSSLQSSSVDSVLRRWIGELAAELAVEPGLPEHADPNAVDTAFASLLHRMALQRRVVVLVDALDQFETTTRGQYLTWLPRLWPPNVRLLMTTIPGEASQTLTERDGIEPLPLPSLDTPEAREIFKGICKRYHREFEPEVINALLARTGADGPAWGNPLWLVLAIEELNLLDADDFARARRYTGTPGEQLRSLMLDDIASFPADIPGLYGYTFKRVEELFGANLTRGFLGLIAVSRAGWRESDFRVLLPRVSGERWDELQFAQLRRLFRGQMRRRGAIGLWDFNHAQMRSAVKSRVVAQEGAKTALHAEISEHLLSLNSDDPLRQTETMVHLLESQNWQRAAQFYGDSSLTPPEVAGATEALVETILAEPSSGPEAALQAVVQMLDAASVDNQVAAEIAHRLQYDLNDLLEGRAAIGIRLAVIHCARDTFNRLATAEPKNADWQRELAKCHFTMGHLLRAQGNLGEALTSFRAARAAGDRAHASNPSKFFGWLRDYCDLQDSIGDVHMAQGDLDEALACYRASFKLREDRVADYPHDVQWQRDLSISHQRIGHVRLAQGTLGDAVASFRASLDIAERLAGSDPGNTDIQQIRSACHENLGNALNYQGDLDAALTSFQASLDIFEHLAANDPKNWSWQNGRSAAQIRIGGVLVAQGKTEAAIARYRSSLSAAEKLATADPSNTYWQTNLSSIHDKIGKVLVAQGDSVGALASFNASLFITERLADSDPSNAHWQRDLSKCHNNIGDLFRARGSLGEALASFNASLAIAERFIDLSNPYSQRDLSIRHDKVGDVLFEQTRYKEALDHFRSSLAIAERLAIADPGNMLWQRDLKVSHSKMGDVFETQRDLNSAHASYQASLVIAERIANADPTNADWQRDLYASLERISTVEIAQGNFMMALSRLRQGHEIIERLFGADPGNADRNRDRSASYECIGDLLLMQENRGEALVKYRAALAINERLAATDHHNARWQHALGILHGKIGDVLQAQGDRDEALTRYRAAQEIVARLVAADPSNAEWQYGLSITLIKIGDVLQARGEAVEALTSFRRALAAKERLASAFLDSFERQRELAVVYRKIGDVLAEVGNLMEALASYRASLRIVERLAGANPTNADWQRDLSRCHNNIGDVLRAQGNLGAAHASYRVSLDIDKRRADSEPHDLGRQMDLALSHGRLGKLMLKLGRREEALDLFRKGRAIIEALVEHSENAKLRRYLSIFDADIAALDKSGD